MLHPSHRFFFFYFFSSARDAEWKIFVAFSAASGLGWAPVDRHPVKRQEGSEGWEDPEDRGRENGACPEIIISD